MFTCFIFARVIGDDETQGKSTYFPHLSLKFSSTKCTKESEEDRRIHFVTSEEGTLFDIDRRSLFLLPLNDDFFFLWYGRSRSKARSLHEKKLLVRKLLHGRRWSHAAWQIMTTKTQTKKHKVRRRSPSQICVSPSKRQQSKQRTGQEPNKKQPKKICQGHSGKNPLCRNELKTLQQTN